MGDPLIFLWFMGLLLFLLGNGRLAELVKLLANIKPPTLTPTTAQPQKVNAQVVNAQPMPQDNPITVNPQTG